MFAQYIILIHVFAKAIISIFLWIYWGLDYSIGFVFPGVFFLLPFLGCRIRLLNAICIPMRPKRTEVKGMRKPRFLPTDC